MSVATLNETRTYERALEYSRDAVIPGIKENAFNFNPLASVMAGRLNTMLFGRAGLQGRGKKVRTGGTTIEGRVNLGQNTNVKTLTGHFDTVDTTPSDTPRHWRANWKEYVGAISISRFEQLANRSPEAIANMVESETRITIGSLVDFVGAHMYDNAGVGSRITSLSSLVSANNSVEGLDGGTYTRWNSRGVSARGTAPGSVTFTPSTTSFASAGLQNLRDAWNGCTEGMVKPDAIFTTHAIYSLYEGQLQPLERFTDARVADGGFQSLLYKTAPIFPDPQCTSGSLYMLNFEHLHFDVMAGADFDAGPFIEDTDSMALVSKVYLVCQLVVENRFVQNKLTGITA